MNPTMHKNCARNNCARATSLSPDCTDHPASKPSIPIYPAYQVPSLYFFTDALPTLYLQHVVRTHWRSLPAAEHQRFAQYAFTLLEGCAKDGSNSTSNNTSGRSDSGMPGQQQAGGSTNANPSTWHQRAKAASLLADVSALRRHVDRALRHHNAAYYLMSGTALEMV